ncbi:MAG: glycoside hydrolase family 2 TIM barrel-domain containing protein [Candidatus Avoscillospira sp.]
MMNREKLLMDFGWRFHLGDITPPAIHPLLIMEVYLAAKSLRGRGAAAYEYNDDGWRTVNLPHDYVIEGTPSQQESSAGASLKREPAWYRRYFRLDPGDRGKRISLEFEGVATHCTVWVNGHQMIRHFGGYNGFEIDITDVAKYGDERNVVAVRVDVGEFEGWWYEGGGIYRHVWLHKTDPLHVGRYGTYIVSEDKGGQWENRVETTVCNSAEEAQSGVLCSRILDAAGRPVAECRDPFTVEAGGETVVYSLLHVKDPALWSPEEPNLYTLSSSIYVGDSRKDVYATTFGYRTILFDPEEGFFLNGVNLKIKGACVHEDFGGQGVGVSDNLKEFRIRRMKEMGCNGYRTAHNLHSEITLDLCDREGMLVMDENRWFESWGDGISQLEDMVRRDRNHPCVIFWSLGNEEPIQGFEAGKKIVRTMGRVIKKLDRTRPVLMAMHTGLLNGQATSVSDVIGVNYNQEILPEIHRANPTRPMVGSENYSVSDEPEADRARGIETWRLVKTLPYMMGYYIWTGIDYRGEHRYPTLLATCGGLDLNCRKKEDFYVYESFWKDAPMVHVGPHWNLTPDEEGMVEVTVVSNAETVELLCNGVSLGKKAADIFDLTPWRVPYTPGELTAIAYSGGKEVARDVVRTAGEPVGLALKLENDGVCANDEDCAVVSATAVDGSGTPVPTACGMVRFSVNGAGELLSTCSGDSRDLDPCPAASRRLYQGQCAAVIRVRAGRGPLEVRVEGDGLADGCLTVEPAACAGRPFVPVCGASSLRGWRISPVFTNRDSLEACIAAGVDDTWRSLEIGTGVYQPDFYNLEDDASFTRRTQFAAYYLNTPAPELASGREASLRFDQVQGKIEVTVRQGDRVWTGRKDDYEPGPAEVRVEGFAPEGAMEILARFEASDTSAGIIYPVHWMSV